MWSGDIGKVPDAGKDWRQEEKGMTEDEMGGWHHQLNRHESEQTLGDSEGQGSLACCRPKKEHNLVSDWTKSGILYIFLLASVYSGPEQVFSEAAGLESGKLNTEEFAWTSLLMVRKGA